MISTSLIGCSDSAGPAGRENGGSTSPVAGAPAAGGTRSDGAGTSPGGAAGSNGGAAGGVGASASGGQPSTGGRASAGDGGNGSGANVPRIASVAKPITLVPAPGLAGPALKVDLDMSGRPTSEVTELGYLAWPLTSGATLSRAIGGVTFTFAKAGSVGSELAAGWQKAAVSAPSYARLVGDGLTVSDGAAGSEIRLTLRGLSPGKHSLLMFHNFAAGSADAEKVDVLVDGVVAISGLTQSVGALSTAAAATSYVELAAQAGKDLIVTYRSTGSIMLNGFELDLPNVAAQATSPVPSDGDEHVAADMANVELSWKASKQATSHDVYVGSEPNAVQAATTASLEFRGNQAATRFTLAPVHSIERYYWRIDERAADGTVTRGNVWYFRPRQVAFPGAEGYGRFAIGGRGGSVVHVTNLNDAGAGSFRDAIETDRGPRTVVFDVGGVIALQSRLVFNQKYITIAGQTAPGKGIVLRAAPFGMSGATDAIVRHLRVRLGHGTTFDGMGLTGSDHSIIDHSSISWTIDEAFSSRNGKNITLQRTLISECLNIAGHQNYPEGTKHGYAASIGGDTGSFHHNLLAHCEGRNWSLAGGLDPSGNFAGKLDIFNNVVYNWGGRTTDGGAHQVNFVNNYYRPGPATKIFTALNAQYDNFPGTQQYYFAGNVMPGYFDETSQDQGKTAGTPNGYSPWVSQAFFPSYAETHSARDAFKVVLSDVGNAAPALDDHDRRIIRETLTGTTTYTGSKSGVKGLPDTEEDVGGYESYPTTTREAAWDSDDDGLPDWWEVAAGSSPSSPEGDFTDANTDADGDGYTALEDYLAWMASPHYFAREDAAVEIDLAELFSGFTENPTFSGDAIDNGALSIAGSKATFTPGTCGHAGFTASVVDKAGSKHRRRVVIFADAASGSCPK